MLQHLALDSVVTGAGGCRPINATTEQFGNVAGYRAATVNGEGNEHASVEALEWTNATTSKFETMTNSAGVLQSRKNTDAMTPTVDRPAIDPKVKRAGQLKVDAAQKFEFQDVQNVKAGEDNAQQVVHEEENISAMQGKRTTVTPGEQFENSSGLRTAVKHVEGKVLNIQSQFAVAPHKVDTKSNNWTVVNKSPSKKQTPGIQNQILSSPVIGVSNSFDALVNEGEHDMNEAKNKEQQRDDETRSVDGKISFIGNISQQKSAEDIDARLGIATVKNHTGCSGSDVRKHNSKGQGTTGYFKYWW
ncbi:hypothetical protein A4A49_24282 [Nicotiana attenuata]|uniref:Uncharacterized protein n=1 Tax=Nicotiana attenuata TaxID=49451 RepID=A0A1J6J7D7_NICAT|nr:hypothetical protein A4A49_24282 [Nicotiana attenuata]